MNVYVRQVVNGAIMKLREYIQFFIYGTGSLNVGQS